MALYLCKATYGSKGLSDKILTYYYEYTIKNLNQILPKKKKKYWSQQ